MNKVYSNAGLEIWGGIECSYNRVQNNYMDQLNLSGHYEREDDISRFAQLVVMAPLHSGSYRSFAQRSPSWTG